MTLHHDDNFFASDSYDDVTSHIKDAERHSDLLDKHYVPRIQALGHVHGDVLHHATMLHGTISINNHLRGINSPDASPENAERLHATLSQIDHTMPLEGHFYHGVSVPSAWNPEKHLKAGEKIKLEGNFSTSTSPNVVKSWASADGLGGVGSKSHILHLHAKEGDKAGVFIRSISKYPREHELLVPHGTVLHYHGHSEVYRPQNTRIYRIHHLTFSSPQE